MNLLVLSYSFIVCCCSTSKPSRLFPFVKRQSELFANIDGMSEMHFICKWRARTRNEFIHICITLCALHSLIKISSSFVLASGFVKINIEDSCNRLKTNLACAEGCWNYSKHWQTYSQITSHLAKTFPTGWGYISDIKYRVVRKSRWKRSNWRVIYINYNSKVWIHEYKLNFNEFGGFLSRNVGWDFVVNTSCVSWLLLATISVTSSVVVIATNN